MVLNVVNQLESLQEGYPVTLTGLLECFLTFGDMGGRGVVSVETEKGWNYLEKHRKGLCASLFHLKCSIDVLKFRMKDLNSTVQEGIIANIENFIVIIMESDLFDAEYSPDVGQNVKNSFDALIVSLQLLHMVNPRLDFGHQMKGDVTGALSEVMSEKSHSDFELLMGKTQPTDNTVIGQSLRAKEQNDFDLMMDQ